MRNRNIRCVVCGESVEKVSKALCQKLFARNTKKYCVCGVYPTNLKSKKMNYWKRQRSLKMKAVYYSNEAVK